MQLTRAADYGVRVMMHLAGLPRGTRVTHPELAAAVEVPESFLSKVLQALAKSALILSHRGSQGGFELAVSPADVSVLDIVEAIQGPMRLNVCLASQAACGRLPLCAAHFVWQEAQAAMVAVLMDATLAKLARKSGGVAAPHAKDREAPRMVRGEGGDAIAASETALLAHTDAPRGAVTARPRAREGVRRWT